MCISVDFVESGHMNGGCRGRCERSSTVTHVGRGRLKEGQKQLPRQQVPQDAGVLHTERLHHGELPHLDPRQDVLTQLLACGQNGHEGRRRGPAADGGSERTPIPTTESFF